VGAAGSAAYHHYEEDQDAKYRQQQEEQAAREAATVAAPDTAQQQYADQAAREAATISSPDTTQGQYAERAAHEAAIISAPDVPTSTNLNTHTMSGGRSQSDLTGAGPNPIETALEPLTEDLRPTLAAGQSHRSVQTISHLHVPGEYPKDAVRRDTLGPNMPV